MINLLFKLLVGLFLTTNSQAQDFIGCGHSLPNATPYSADIPSGPICITLPKYSFEDDKTLAGRRKEYLLRENLTPQEILARFIYAETITAQANQSGEVAFIMEIIGQVLINRINWAKTSPQLGKVFGEVQTSDDTPEKQNQNLLNQIFMPGEFHVTAQDASPSKLFLCPLVTDQQLEPSAQSLWDLALKTAQTIFDHPQTNILLQTTWEKRKKLSLIAKIYYPKRDQSNQHNKNNTVVETLGERQVPMEYVVLVRNLTEKDL